MRYKTFLTALLIASAIAGSQPITGEADSLEFLKDKVIYSGNVRLTRGESVLKADKVIIFLDKEGNPTKIVAEGGVNYVEGNRRASAKSAEYDLSRDTIVLRGDARVEEDKNLLEAEEIVYDRKNQTLKAVGDNSRVRTIYVEEEDNEKVRHSP